MEHHITRWRDIIDQSGRPLPELSKAIGKDRTYLTKLFARAEEGNFQDPGVFTMMKLASELGLRIDQLMAIDLPISALPSPVYRNELSKVSLRIVNDIFQIGFQAKTVGRPDMVQVLQWWHRSNGQVGVGHEIEEHADLIYPPESGDHKVKVHRVGETSLAALVMGNTQASTLEKLAEEYPTDIRNQLLATYQSVYRHQKIDLARIKAPVPILGRTKRTEVVYYRLLLPVQTPDGTPFIMNYSTNLEATA